MRSIFRAINRLLEEHEDIQVVYPLHMITSVREVADEILGKNDRVYLIERLEVVDFRNFSVASHVILTDSGSIQEESPSLGKLVIILRDTTKRSDGIEAGTLKLAGTDEVYIYTFANETKPSVTKWLRRITYMVTVNFLNILLKH